MRAEAERIAQAIKTLTPVLPGAEISVQLDTSRPPMEHDALMIRTFAQVQSLAVQHGFMLGEDGSGGGSDGNITAAIGVPTLDGLGSHGEGAHALTEQCLIPSLARRAVLLSAILRDWIMD